MEALQFQLPQRCRFDPLLDTCLHRLGMDDRYGLCSTAKSRGQVGNAADWRIFTPAVEANKSQRCVPGSDPNAKSEVMSSVSPIDRHPVYTLAHVQRQPYR